MTTKAADTNDIDAEHVLQCRLTMDDCARCLFIRNSAKWFHEFKWLIVSECRTKVGCSTCYRYSCRTKFGRCEVALAGKFRKSVLLTHNETDSHLSCVKAGKRDKVTHIADGEAPAAKAFEVW